MEVDKRPDHEFVKTETQSTSRIRRLAHYLHKNPKELLALLVILLIAISALAAWGTIVYKHHADSVAITKEREQYQKAEKTIENLALKTQHLVGAPVDQENNNYCSYASSFSELGKGDLSCSASIDLIYSVKSQDEARQLAPQINEKILKRSVTLSSSDLESALHPPVDLGADDFVDSVSGLSCSFSYVYYLDGHSLGASGYLSLKGLDDRQGLMLIISCGGRPAKAAYYPVY